MEELVREVIALVDSEARHCNIKIQLEPHDPLPIVLADPILIQQVILNLVQNAIQAMAQTERHRHQLTIRITAKEQKVIELEVSDTGHGIAAKDPEDVFKPFHTTRPDGIGMGLTLSRSILEAHGGHLSIESTSEHGTTFRMTLPVMSDKENEHDN